MWRRLLVNSLWAVFFALAWMLGASGCAGETSSAVPAGGNLLSGLSPIKSQGVRRPEVLTDGVMARIGDSWNTELTAVFRTEASFVEYDLGSSKEVHAGYLQADNNDTYILSVSDDDATFRTLWNAPPRPGGGLQERSSQELKAAGRYLRISAMGGDRAYALSEVQVFSDVPAIFPPHLPMRTGLEVPERLRSQILLFAFALGVWLLATFHGSPLVVRVAAIAFTVFEGIGLAQAIDTAWPVEERDVSLVRATAAALA